MRILTRYSRAFCTHARNPEALSVAPMMDYTDRHYRYLLRQITRKTRLYTDMLVDRTLIHNRHRREHSLKRYHQDEPVSVQLGGCDPETMGEAARIVADYGYNNININVGCPSARVKSGAFGVSLMKEPERVARIAEGMMEAARGAEVTVKCRIGVDNADSETELWNFIRVVEGAGVRHFVVHARKAFTNGLSPEQNRSIPPLNYPRVYNLLKEFPKLTFGLNGGVRTLDDARQHLDEGKCHSIMIGRAVIANPMMLAAADDFVENTSCTLKTENVPAADRYRILEQYAEHVWQEEIAESPPPRALLIKPVLKLFAGCPNGKQFRRLLQETSGNTPLSDAILFAARNSGVLFEERSRSTPLGSFD